jgi:hypothetical protein
VHLVGVAIEIMSQHSSDFFGDIKCWLTIACSSREQNQLPDIAAEETEVNLFKQTKLNRMSIKEHVRIFALDRFFTAMYVYQQIP